MFYPEKLTDLQIYSENFGLVVEKDLQFFFLFKICIVL